MWTILVYVVVLYGHMTSFCLHLQGPGLDKSKRIQFAYC